MIAIKKETLLGAHWAGCPSVRMVGGAGASSAAAAAAKQQEIQASFRILKTQL